MTGQLALPDQTWGCDICAGTGLEIDPETLGYRNCRVCSGTGALDYDPSVVREGGPFAGMDTT